MSIWIFDEAENFLNLLKLSKAKIFYIGQVDKRKIKNEKVKAQTDRISYKFH